MSFFTHLYHFCRTTSWQLRGRGALARLIYSSLSDGSGFFPWKLHDGQVIAIRPDEAALNFGVGGVCFLERAWEPHISDILGRLLRPGDNTIDVGANIGVFTCRMARLVSPQGKVIAFEPSRTTYDQLTSSIRYSDAQNVVSVNAALGSSGGKLELRVPLQVSANASAFIRKSEGKIRVESVEVVTLDSEVTRIGLNSLKLIKVDAEGAELDVLRGAMETLKKFRPAVVVEWNPETATLAGWTINDLLQLMQECGPYETKLVWREGKLVTVNAESIEVEPGGYLDLLFISKIVG